MINRLAARFRRPEKGWDPIPASYAASYADIAYSSPPDEKSFQAMLDLIPGRSRPKMLDLGGGPGHNAVYFARRGCDVTWHDISSHYLAIARRKFEEAGLPCVFSLGYMEEAEGTYDLVLVSQCWYYCLSDDAFAEKLVSLLKPNGIAFATINNEVFFRKMNVHFRPLKRYARIFQFLLNDLLNLKIGHPFPSHAKITRVVRRLQRRHRLSLCTALRSGHYTLLTLKKGPRDS